MEKIKQPGQDLDVLIISRIRWFSLVLKPLAICAVLFGGCLQLSSIQVQQAASIHRITVTGEDQDLGVEIATSVPITPRTQTVTDPDRLIVDLPEVLPSGGLHKMVVNRGKLKDIRVGILSANPRITRVVLDLVAPTQFQVSGLGKMIVVKLRDESEAVPVAATTNLAGAKTAETTSVATIPPSRSAEPSRARWILPILFTATVLAMIVVALVAHIQNRRGRRGV